MSLTTPVVIRRFRPTILIQGEENTLTAQFYTLTGSVVPIASGTVTVYNPDGASISSGVVTIADDIATYTVPAAATSGETRGPRYKISWRMDSCEADERAALVTVDLWCPITVEDLEAEEPILGTLTHGDDSTGQRIGWERTIEATYKAFYAKLQNVDRWPWLVTSPDAFRGYLLNDALARAFRSLGKGNASNYREHAEAYQKMAAAEWNGIMFTYDEDDDGITRAAESGQSAEPVIYIGSAPGATYRRGR